MLGRIILVLLQLLIGFAAGPYVQRYISVGGDVQNFINGAIYALVIYLVGLIAAQIVKDVPTPSPAALTYALIGGLIGAAIIATGFYHQIPVRMPQQFYPLILAVVGYTLKR